MQRIATDLSSSKDQIREVKELLLRLINPQTSNFTSTSCPTSDGNAPCQGSGANVSGPCTHGTGVNMNPQCEANTTVHEIARESSMRPVNDSQNRTPSVQVPQRTGVPAVTPSRSWASGDTIPVTPNSFLQKFTNKMPVGAAVSTDISASIRSGAAEHSPHPSVDTISQYREPVIQTGPCNTNPSSECELPNSACGNNDGVSTRRMTATAETDPTPRAPRQRFEYGLLP